MKMRKINWKVLIISLIVVYAVAFIGSIFTVNVNTSWYETIKPSITPPNWVFPIVWNILFFLIALSLYFSWVKAKDKKSKLVIVFGINFLFNTLWSLFFFTLKNPILAFYEIILLWLSIFLMISATYKINKTSCYFLIPYLLWVSFAGVLNFLMAF